MSGNIHNYPMKLDLFLLSISQRAIARWRSRLLCQGSINYSDLANSPRKWASHHLLERYSTISYKSYFQSRLRDGGKTLGSWGSYQYDSHLVGPFIGMRYLQTYLFHWGRNDHLHWAWNISEHFIIFWTLFKKSAWNQVLVPYMWSYCN